MIIAKLILSKIIWSVGVKPFNPGIFWTFFGGIGTIFAIFLAYYLYRKDIARKETAQINAIIDEIFSNIKLAFFAQKERKEKEIKYIIYEINKLTMTSKYPNPDEKKDSPFEHRLFSGCYDNYDPKKFFEVKIVRDDFFHFNNMAISQAMATGTASLLSSRIFLNLKHLDYSIKRLNIKIIEWNSLKKETLDQKTIQSYLQECKKEYFVWLHFRLIFTLVDILRTYPSKYIYDQNILNEYKKLAGSTWETV